MAASRIGITRPIPNLKNWTPGARSIGAPDVMGMGLRENLARGRRRDMDDPITQEHRRPLFDLMGKMREWGMEKQMGRGRIGKYFYLEYLVDMEGYPEEIKDHGTLSRVENLNLSLLSLAEERKFWKAFYYYTNQYEVENEENMAPLEYLQSASLVHSLRMAGLASPSIFSSFCDHGIDDTSLSGISLTADYSSCKFPDNLRNVLDGHFLHHLLTTVHGRTPEEVQDLILNIQKLKIVPVELLDSYGNVVDSKLCTFDEIPDLDAVVEAFGLEGGLDRWFVDVRNFYSTPGKMIFDDYNYHSFLLDWFYTGSFKYQVDAGKGLQLAPKPIAEVETEKRRGWFNVI